MQNSSCSTLGSVWLRGLTPLCARLVAKRSEPRTKKYPQGNHCFLFLVLKDYLSIGQPDANPGLGYFLHAAANSLLVFRCHFLLHLKCKMSGCPVLLQPYGALQHQREDEFIQAGMLVPGMVLEGLHPQRGAAGLQLEQSLRLEAGEQEVAESRSLAQHNIELRRLLDEEQAAYKRKLQAYQEGQQRQAQLVQKLQAKVGAYGGHRSAVMGRDWMPSRRPQVLQYKKKCGEVEQQLLRKETELEQERLTVCNVPSVSPNVPYCHLHAKGTMSPQSQPEEESPNELENALIRLEEEQQRCEGAPSGAGGCGDLLASSPALCCPGAAAWCR